MKELEDKIIDLFKKGYTTTEIMSEMHTEFASDENKYFTFVKKTIKKNRAEMSQEEKDALAQKRKERSEAERTKKIVDIATQVKLRVDNDNSGLSQKEKLSQAVKAVAMLNGITKTDTVRAYTKQTYPCFYDEYANNKELDADYCVYLAKKIISEKIPKTRAIKMHGFNIMYKLIEEKEPELFIKLNDTFNEVDKKVFGHTLGDLGGQYFFNNHHLLIDIILEFRVPFSVFCEFLFDNPIFAVKGIREETFLEAIKCRSEDKDAIEWYIAELWSYRDSSKYDEYINYRIERFKEFAKKFYLLSNDFEKLCKFIKSETNIGLSSVINKIDAQDYKGLYNFDNNDIRKILKYVYKYGLGEPELQKTLGVPRMSKTRLVMRFVPESFEDEMLAIGCNKLNEYKSDMSYAYRVGRK